MSRDDDLGERVLAARGRSVASPPPEAGGGGAGRKVGWGAVAVIAAAAIIFVVVLGRRGTPPDTSGVAQVNQRREVQLGYRGVAVLEAGAEIEWRVGSGGARIEQRAGDVFYRADRGGRFAVTTAAGAIEATAPACFRVRVDGGTVDVTVLQGVVAAAGRRVGGGDSARLGGP